MTREEYEKESDEYKIGWGNPYLKRVLTRDPSIRSTPPKLNDHEKEININLNPPHYKK